VLTILIGRIAEDPNSRMLHLDYSRDPLSCSEPENRNANGPGKRITVHRNDAERMAWQSKAAQFSRTAIQHVKEHALSEFNFDRFAMARVASKGKKSSAAPAERCEKERYRMSTSNVDTRPIDVGCVDSESRLVKISGFDGSSPLASFPRISA
jgi:hypothetical protein